MKAFLDKYKYILGLGLALVAVVIIAIVSAVAGKDTAENSGTSYLSSETSSFTSTASLNTTTVPKTTVNSQAPPVTTVTDTSSQTTALQTTSQTTSGSRNEETTATAAPVVTVPATTAVTSKATEKPIKKYDNTCTFTIDCKTILNNKDKLRKGLEKYVPGNGMIYSGTVGFNNDESVYDILRRICDENNIQTEASFTPAFGSYYVEGINNLYEFDCGQGSGWMYSVNGVFPNYGCSSYKPVNNDKIAFRYTCELGNDFK